MRWGTNDSATRSLVVSAPLLLRFIGSLRGVVMRPEWHPRQFVWPSFHRRSTTLGQPLLRRRWARVDDIEEMTSRKVIVTFPALLECEKHQILVAWPIPHENVHLDLPVDSNPCPSPTHT